MIFHPGILSLLFGSLLISLMLCYAASQAGIILRKWDIASGSELQLKLERRTYLVSTLVVYSLIFQLFSLFLFIYTADSLSHLFTGAMCAAGSLNVNSLGYPTVVLKGFNFLFAGLWLVINHVDSQAYDYPLIKVKYRCLLVLAPLVVLESAMQAGYLLKLEPNLITSCCSVIFDQKSDTTISWLVALPAKTVLWSLAACFLLLAVTGVYSLFRRKGAVFFSLAVFVFFGVALEAVISAVSVYIYELPTHHCPFCILHAEYAYIGYFLYLPLLIGTIAGLAVAILQRYGRIASLGTVIPAQQRFLTLVSLVSLSFFFFLCLYSIAISHLVL